MRLFALLALTLVTCGDADSFTRDDLLQVINDARACDPGDSCILAGSSQCTCQMPINAESEDDVTAAAEQVDCEGRIVQCVGWTNLRCEDGLCIADEID